MSENDTLHILVSCESQSQLESYVGCFRELGHSVRAQRIVAGKDLADALENPDWDLLIAVENHPELTPLQALQLMRARSSTVPCIVHLLGTESLGDRDYLREGAADVITSNDDERLSLCGMRAIRVRRDRRELEELRVKYEETARRCELLLATSNDAIGYLVDGMHVDTNDAYAELFGYADKDELIAIPLVDLISPDNQADFKAALKAYRSNPEDETSIEFTGIREDQGEFPATLVLSTASFEGEPCMQALVRPQARVAPAAPAPAPAQAAAPVLTLSDPGAAVPTGPQALAAMIDAAGQGQLVLLAIDDFATHLAELGPTAAWSLGSAVADFLSAELGLSGTPVRAGDSVLGICLPGSDPEHSLAKARSAIEKIGGHIFEIGEQSARCSLCAMVSEIGSDGFVTGAALLDASWKSLHEVARRSADKRATDGARAQLMVAGQSGGAVSGGVGALSDALGRAEFSLTFQPIISLRGDSIEHYEVRVMHSGADGASTLAAQWLDANHLAEKSSQLDRWTLENALERLAQHLPEHPNTRLVVPIGAGSLSDEEFLPWLTQVLHESPVGTDHIALQLHHRTARSRLKQAERLSMVLKEVGAELCISGIDVANNPLEDLSLLKPALVRIDESLGKTLENFEQTNQVLKPLIDALHQDQMSSIMPGVQAAGALAVLWQLGVGYIQGDYMQAPSPDMHYDFADLA